MNSEKSRENLVSPWKAGQSGNPSGRPKGLVAHVKKEIGSDGARAFALFVSVLNDERASRSDRVQAAAWLVDRGFGKATQLVAGDDEQAPLRVDRPATADPAALARELEQLGLKIRLPDPT